MRKQIAANPHFKEQSWFDNRGNMLELISHTYIKLSIHIGYDT